MKQIALKNWWIITLKGIITIVFGVLTLTLGLDQLLYIFRFFGLIIIISGLSLLSFSLATKKYTDRSWKITEGFIDTIVGVNILVFPQITPALFIATIAIWISFMGILQILNGYRIRSLYHHWWFLIFNGILAVLFAVIVMILPQLEMLTKVILIGFQSIVFGGFLFISSVYIKKLIDDIRLEIPHKEGDEGNQELSYF